jgi:hypothetical protein
MKSGNQISGCEVGVPTTWEHGSDFHWPDFQPAEVKARHPWSDGPSAFFGSGRDALCALVHHGITTLGWRRVWVPGFFCQEVVAAMGWPGIEHRSYPDSPIDPPIWPQELEGRDALLVVNYFGLRPGQGLPPIRTCGAAVIEDHTHDPWSSWAYSSSADFCIASLRKTLPVPEGGVIWSPGKNALPPEPPATEERQRAADAKRVAMLLKSLYLTGHPVAKEDFRTLYMNGEAGIASGAISGMTRATRVLLDCFPVTAWREKRRRNFEFLANALEFLPGIRVLRPKENGSVPFSAVLVTDHPEIRQMLRDGLIQRRIYPAVLWSLEEPVTPGIPASHIDLSRRILSLHCDARYGEEDMRRVFEAVAEILGA